MGASARQVAAEIWDLALANDGLAWTVARKFIPAGRQHGLDFEDLHSIAVLGLVHALERFDPERGHKLSSYAVLCMRGYILFQLQRRSMIRMPANMKGRYPAIAASLNRKLAGTDIEWIDALAAPRIERDHDYESTVRAALAVLHERQRLIVRRRFWDDASFAEIGRDMKISGERVRQIYEEAMQALRAHFGLATSRAERAA